MANFTKWLGGVLGWSFGGPIGAIIGYVIGNAIDGFTQKDVKQFRDQGNARSTQSGDFEISLLILSSVVIKADGKIDQKELDYVRSYFLRLYGKERANNAFKLFKGIQKQNVSVRQVCLQMNQHMQHATRLQLMHYLFSLALSDGHVSTEELDILQKIAQYLNINSYDFNSIKAMFVKETGSAYKILEVEKSATDDEIKKAYRKLVKKHHPDKVQQLGPEHMKGAQEKFLKIQEAYEKIKKERGF